MNVCCFSHDLKGVHLKNGIQLFLFLWWCFSDCNYNRGLRGLSTTLDLFFMPFYNNSNHNNNEHFFVPFLQLGAHST